MKRTGKPVSVHVVGCSRRRGAWRIAPVVAGILLTLAVAVGCTSPDTSVPSGGPAAPTGGASAATSSATTPPSGEGPVVVVPESIPDGRKILGDGNPEYTFLSLWKRAVPTALQWKGDAYLASASGSFVNDDGVPSEWMMVFRTRAAGSPDLRVWIDPWGKVTRTEKTPADDTYGTRAVMPGIVDSDAAVTVGRSALKNKGVTTTKDPRLGLGFKGDVGPFWYYVVLSNGNYVTATIDALTGKATGVK